MNLAFPAAFLFALLLPGLIFLRFYDRGRGIYDHRGRAKESGSQLLPGRPLPERLQNEIARSPIPAVVLHLVWISICKLIGHPVDLKASIALELGIFGKGNSFFDDALNSVAIHPFEVAIYFLSICCGAAALGYLLSWIVWENRLDQKFPILKEDDDWFYLFRGEHPARRDLAGHKPNLRVVGVRVSALVVCGAETLIYRGFYVNHTGRGGTLDEIWLQAAERRHLSEDKIGNAEAEIFYQVPGDLLIVKASEIRTINLTYIHEKSVTKTINALKAKIGDSIQPPNSKSLE